jgi:glycosyltransferase involved in cell wall biosynthesis
MDLSILVPTYNRPDFLIRLLRSLEGAKPGDLEWELLVVDNNSAADRFAAIQAALAESPLPARLLSEPTPGKSRALNTAIRAARGRLVAFLDHDVSVHPGYLVGVQEECSRPGRRSRRTGSGSAGRSRPRSARS